MFRVTRDYFPTFEQPVALSSGFSNQDRMNSSSCWRLLRCARRGFREQGAAKNQFRMAWLQTNLEAVVQQGTQRTALVLRLQRATDARQHHHKVFVRSCNQGEKRHRVVGCRFNSSIYDARNVWRRRLNLYLFKGVLGRVRT